MIQRRSSMKRSLSSSLAVMLCALLIVASIPAQAANRTVALPAADIALQVDAAARRHPISPLIYGINAYSGNNVDFQALISQLRLPVQRWGGNITTRYNWKNNIANHANDFYFENIPEATTAEGNIVDHLIGQ